MGVPFPIPGDRGFQIPEPTTDAAFDISPPVKGFKSMAQVIPAIAEAFRVLDGKGRETRRYE